MVQSIGEGHSVSTTKQDRLFLTARRGGMNCRAIAARFGVCVKTVYNGIERARLLERPAGTGRQRTPKLVPLFPLTPLTPRSTCPHHQPIRKGSVFICMVCHATGVEHLPLFRRHPSDPRPDPKPKAAKKQAPTRKERRSILSVTQPSSN